LNNLQLGFDALEARGQSKNDGALLRFSEATPSIGCFAYKISDLTRA